MLTAGAGVLLGFLRIEHNNAQLDSTDIHITYNTSDTLLDEHDILQVIGSVCGEIRGKTYEQVNFREIETKINRNYYVSACDVDALLNGTLRIRIKQRVPMLRIVTENSSYYIDTTGFVMPLATKYSARVPVVSGNIGPVNVLVSGKNIKMLSDTNKELASGRLIRCYQLAKYVFNDPRLRPLIDQIYENDHGELELISKFGSHTILFGDADNIEQKFNNLLAFYQQGIKKYGWGAFDLVNLKYNNQVVCSKNQ